MQRRTYRNDKKTNEIVYWIHEPARPRTNLIILPGFETRGEQYQELALPFEERDVRVVLVEPHEGTHPVRSVGDYARLVMTLYRHLSKDMDLRRHHLLPYSAGNEVAEVLATDPASDHTPPASIGVVGPAVPGQHLTLSDYALRFFKMGTRMRFGAYGPKAKIYAKEEGFPYMGRVLHHREESESFLQSLDKLVLPGAISMPVHVVCFGNDEFFAPEVVANHLQQVAPRHTLRVIEKAPHAQVLYDARPTLEQLIPFYETRFPREFAHREKRCA